jgi:glycosyltransferase involved in cell wall biosynthesis
LNIVFAIKALGNQGGGAERVLVEVASGLTRRGHSVTIFTSDQVGTSSYYPLDARVRLTCLGIGDTLTKSTIREILLRLVRLKQAILDVAPDIVVGFMQSTYVPLGFALKTSGIPLIASEHIGPEHYSNRWLERFVLNATPLVAARITVVSTQILQSFNPWLRRKMTAVPNPVAAVAHAEDQVAHADGPEKLLLCVGRLTPQKDHAVLISAFAMIAAQFPEWRLRIVGEGELRGMLQDLIDSLGVGGQVVLAGATSRIDAEYAAADLFVLPSSYESFGLATAEALLHGLPAVGFADCPGTNELIRDGENGQLVHGADRKAALASVLAGLMQDPTERARLSAPSRQWILDRYGIEGVIDQWEAVFSEARATPD